MKTFVKFLFVVAVTGIVLACTKFAEPVDQIQDVELKSAKTHTVTLPFKADFMGTYLDGSGPNQECGDCPVDAEGNPVGPECWGIVFNDGEGTGTHLGKFRHHFEFCFELITGLYPGDGGHMEAWFVAANGDTLFVTVAGQVINGRLNHHPEDVNSYFTDPWEIVGGTGRFEGATGGGMTDDYNRDSSPANSFHHWTGTITLAKAMKEKTKGKR